MALTVIETKPPELILLDVRMPEMDGFEVCRQLKADEKASGIPVLFLSALHETTDKVKRFNAGGLDFITKPFQVEEVLVRVDTHLSLSRLRTHLDQQIKKRTAELAESEEQFQAFMENTPGAVYIKDENDVHLYCNRFAAEAAKMTPEEFVGARTHDLFPTKVADRLVVLDQKVLNDALV